MNRQEFFDALSEGFKVGAQGAQTKAASEERAALQEYLSKLKDQQKQNELSSQVELLKLLQGQNPNTSVTVKGVGVNARPSGASVNSQPREDSNTRNETVALQNEYNKLGIGDIRKKLTALQTADTMLNSPKGLDPERIGSLIRNLFEVGVATDKDVARWTPTTWRSLTNKIGAFADHPNLVNPYGDEMLSDMKSFVKSQKDNILKQADTARMDISGRAENIAPSLARRGKLQSTLTSLGSGVEDLVQGGQTPVQAAPQQPQTGLKVKVQDAQGNIFEMPQENLEKAISRGYKKVGP